MENKKGFSERIKERIAQTATDALTVRGKDPNPCILVLLGEPKMPDELLLEDAE
jgi:hypothetical protein